MGSSCSRMEEGRIYFKIITLKPIGKRPLGRPKHRWYYNIRIFLKEIGINTKNWVDSVLNIDNWRENPYEGGIEPA